MTVESGQVTKVARSPLARRLVVAIVLFSSIITLVITAIQIRVDYEQELSDIDAEFEQIRHSSLHSVSQSVWVLDELQVRNQLKGLTKLSSIEFAAVNVEGKQRWAVGQQPDRDQVSARFPLTYQHRGETLEIGELVIIGTLDNVYHRLMDRVLFILFGNGLKTSLVALFSLFLFYHLLGRYILDLKQFADRFGEEQDLPLFSLNRKRSARHQPDELDSLAASINHMVKTLRNREDDLRVFATTVEQSPSSVLLTDADGNIVYVNPTFTEISGYTLDDVYGKKPAQLTAGLTADEVSEQIWETIRSGGVWAGELKSRSKSGTIYWESVKIGPVLDKNGEIIRYILVNEDITLRKSYEEQLLHQANYDGLTNLPNRLLAFDRIAQAMVTAQREKCHVVVMFLDLDRFKNVNDTLGHALGDELLVEAAKRLRSCIRVEDTVARLGGDEFLIILPGIQKTQNAELIARKVLQAMAAPFFLNGRELYITASIGITIYPEDSDSPEILLRNADVAMYQAKAQGSNSFCFFTQTMNNQARARLEIESELRHAQENRELELHFQPIVDARSGQIVAAEGLLRWNNPTLGRVSPDTFVPLAEDIGLILPIGDWVLRTACHTAMTWQQSGRTPVRVCVNASVRQFRNGNIVQTIASVLEESGLPAHCLEVEITEGLLLDDAPEIQEILNKLHRMGVRISIDDFGTGYSSLCYLKKFPFDVLKIDQSFVRDVINDPDDAALAAAIIHMAHQLKLEVVGEGVETTAQLHYLQDNGLDMVQGYLFSKPVTAEGFKRLLDQKKSHGSLSGVVKKTDSHTLTEH
ncbi:hypothetical protein AAY24_08770 [Sedimenticola thiotaurini]|uniref:cyclic-guanylate-specific phosphodiesterase n=1 Tax=Sedimenticola thiotaurini TaxID=1543721 RepID=A0A0F7K0B9_9GAMM|nr:hypothetical protein AAY24_08770 [Sedimenticola thiotaurini]